MLYSDGLVENRRRGLDTGLDELVAVAAQAPAEVVADPDELIGYLVEAMMTGYEQDDDVTVLVVQMPAQDAEAALARANAAATTGRGRSVAEGCGEGQAVKVVGTLSQRVVLGHRRDSGASGRSGRTTSDSA